MPGIPHLFKNLSVKIPPAQHFIELSEGDVAKRWLREIHQQPITTQCQA
ncbi:MAG: hypothetical protein M0Z37_02325 [Nitrospiraceae bacterium]|nr:hypothetical protein [Nitrospiraceae bacterium]